MGINNGGGGGVSPTNTYWSGYIANSNTWSTTSGTYVDPSPSGTNTLTTRFSNSLTVTAAASNLPGITFTPISSSAVYMITANFTGTGTTGGAIAAYRMTDGTQVINTTGSEPGAANEYFPTTLTGIYAPGTGSAVTVKIQIATIGGGTARIADPTFLNPAIEWTVIQIK